MKNPEQLKLERAALFAWWNLEGGIEQAPCEVDWDCTKDTWTDGFETGYRAAQRAETERLERADEPSWRLPTAADYFPGVRESEQERYDLEQRS